MQAFVDAEAEQVDAAYRHEVQLARDKMRYDWDEMQRIREHDERARRNPPAGAQRRSERGNAARARSGAEGRARRGRRRPGGCARAVAVGDVRT